MSTTYTRMVAHFPFASSTGGHDPINALMADASVSTYPQFDQMGNMQTWVNTYINFSAEGISNDHIRVVCVEVTAGQAATFVADFPNVITRLLTSAPATYNEWIETSLVSVG